MRLSTIIEELDLEIIVGEDGLSIEPKGVYIGDLLSLVISKGKKDDIWITIQTHMNIIAVASLVELSAIIIAEEMEIDEDTILKAKEVKVPLLRSKNTAYELACKLSKIGL